MKLIFVLAPLGEILWRVQLRSHHWRLSGMRDLLRGIKFSAYWYQVKNLTIFLFGYKSYIVIMEEKHEWSKYFQPNIFLPVIRGL